MRILASWILAFFLTGSAVPNVQAGEVSTEDIFKDSFYGGLVGALVGGALLVFKDNRSDHFDMIGYGAAVGVIAGAVYGMTRAGRAFAEIDGGKMVLRVPDIRVESGRLPSGQNESIARGRLVTFLF